MKEVLDQKKSRCSKHHHIDILHICVRRGFSGVSQVCSELWNVVESVTITFDMSVFAHKGNLSIAVMKLDMWQLVRRSRGQLFISRKLAHQLKDIYAPYLIPNIRCVLKSANYLYSVWKAFPACSALHSSFTMKYCRHEVAYVFNLPLKGCPWP